MKNSEYSFSSEEAKKLAEKIDREEVTNEKREIDRDKVEEKLKEIVKDRKPDPTYYEGLWLNNLMKVERKLGRDFDT